MGPVDEVVVAWSAAFRDGFGKEGSEFVGCDVVHKMRACAWEVAAGEDMVGPVEGKGCWNIGSCFGCTSAFALVGCAYGLGYIELATAFVAASD